MADSPINSLPQVGNLPNGQPDIELSDLFVLEHAGEACKLTGDQITKFVNRNVQSYNGRIVASDDAGGAEYDSTTDTLTLVIPHGSGIDRTVKGDTRAATSEEVTLLEGTVTTYKLYNEATRVTTGEIPSREVGEFTVYNGRNGQGLVNSVMGVGPSAGTSDVPYQQLFNKIYPVGAIYMSATLVNPGELFGGTWEQIKDHFLLAAGDTYSVPDEGGNATQTVNFSNGYADIGFSASGSYTLTMRENPNARFTSVRGINLAFANNGDSSVPAALEGSQTLNNMPPYTTVYVWKRTALA